VAGLSSSSDGRQNRLHSFLKEMARDQARNARTKILAHAALARLGERNSLDHVAKALAHVDAGVRLAAAEGLWRLGRRDGFQVLVELTRLRPLETGREGVSTGNGVILKVESSPGRSLKCVRRACELLGEMRDPRAVAAIKQLLTENLNGVLARGGSGTGWSGRPDAVALAKLGDFSGIPLLRESIRKDDPLGAIGSWGSSGDFVEIGLKRFIPDVLPMLESRDAGKRVLAAHAIIVLLERGR
jgi:HEAT repeat protein